MIERPLELVELVAIALVVAWLALRSRIRRRLRPYWRELLIRLGIRRITPARGERLPSRLVVVEPPGDTGGGTYRPKHRPQDPSKDPQEPYGSESSSRGNDHGWSGCTMSSSADALAYATAGDRTPWGGDMRHRQGDLEGGTDLYDAADAFRAYGEELKIRSGSGWSRVVEDHEAGRAIVIQGTGQVPGSGDFDGGHACAIGIETHSDGRWLFGDPLVTDWQWIEPSKIRSWAERWQSSIAYAVTVVVPASNGEHPPDSGGEPEPDKTPYGYSSLTSQVRAVQPATVAYALARDDDELVESWHAWMVAPAPGPADGWDRGAWHALADELLELLEDGAPDPCDPDAELAPASWSRGILPPYPAGVALRGVELLASWELAQWAGARWRWPAIDSPALDDAVSLG